MGHAKAIDVARGRTTREDKVGNDGADALVVAGAASHAVPSEVLDRAAERRHMANSVHAMMLHVLHERLSCEGGVSTFDHSTWLDDNIVDHGRSVVGSELCLNDEFDGGISILRLKRCCLIFVPGSCAPGVHPMYSSQILREQCIRKCMLLIELRTNLKQVHAEPVDVFILGANVSELAAIYTVSEWCE